MECSRIVGNAEEQSRTDSNESGWTSYLISSDQRNIIDDRSEGNCKDHGHDTDNKKYYRKGDACSVAADGSESDDSLASDASSGPSHRKTFLGANQVIPGLSHSERATSRCSPKEKLRRHVKQRDGGRSRIGRGESFVKAKTGASQVPSSA